MIFIFSYFCLNSERISQPINGISINICQFKNLYDLFKGGAIYCYNISTNFEIKNFFFFNCSSINDDGGGIYFFSIYYIEKINLSMICIFNCFTSSTKRYQFCYFDINCNLSNFKYISLYNCHPKTLNTQYSLTIIGNF